MWKSRDGDLEEWGLIPSSSDATLIMIRLARLITHSVSQPSDLRLRGEMLRPSSREKLRDLEILKVEPTIHPSR